jgi:hypothetical protein
VPQATPFSTTLLSAATVSSGAPQLAATRRLPFVLGGLVIAGAATVIALVLANQASSPRNRLASSEQIATAAPRPSADTIEGTAVDSTASQPRAAQPGHAAAAPAAAPPQPQITAGDLEAECRRYAADRKWDALAQCAGQLKPLAPKRAAELATRATEEARSAPRIIGLEAALRDDNVKQAKIELDQIWAGSVEYPRLKHAYDLVEAHAIDELAAQLDHAKSPSCDEYSQLLAKQRSVSPIRVIAEATRRTPCAGPPKCNPDALSQKALEHFSANELTESLSLFDAAYACKPTAALLQKAFVIACNLRDAARARSYWKRLPPPLAAQALPTCVRNDITEATLTAP